MYRRLMLPVGLGLILMLAGALGWLTSDAAPLSTPGAAPRVALPAVDVGGEWSTTLTVQNLGAATYAVLDLYPVGAECTLSAFTPAFRYCLGDIAPLQARTTTLMGIPAGQYSGYITAYSACPESGGAPTASPLAVVVARQRAQDGQTAASAYTALAPSYDGWDADSERYIYFSPHVRTSPGTGGTVISVQNTSDQCASVRALFYPESFADNAGCAPQAGAVTADIPPGGSFRFDPVDAGLPLFFGAARLESDQPLAVTTDVTAGGDRQMFTYTGQPYRPGESLAVLPLVLSMPLNPSPWLSNLKAQNPSGVDATLVSETLRNRDGSSASSVLSQRLCPGSSRLLQVRDFSQDPNFIGSADIVNGPGVVILQNTSLDQLEGYSALAASETGSALSLPRLRREESNGTVTLRSQIAVRNLDIGAGATVSLTLYDETGQALDTETEEVEPDGTLVFDLAGLAYLGDGWRGSGMVRAGGSNARLAVVVLERSAVAGSDLSRAYVGARVVQIPPTPTPTTSPTATDTPVPPTLTPTVTPTGEPGTATPTPTNTPTPLPTLAQITPAPGMAGYVVSSAPNTNFFGSGEIYSGHDRRPLKPLTWIGALQFDVSSVPNNATLVGAEVLLTGKTSAYLDGASGVRWEAQLLDESVDAGWRTISYLTLAQAVVDDRLTPTVTRTEVGEAVVNTFTFSAAGLAALQQRLATTDRVSLRIVATQPGVGYRAIFTWDSGMATGNWVRPPVLRLSYR